MLRIDLSHLGKRFFCFVIALAIDVLISDQQQRVDVVGIPLECSLHGGLGLHAGEPPCVDGVVAE